MIITKTGIDYFIMTDEDTEYLLEIEDRYDDIWFEVTRIDGKEITQAEREKVMQCYYEE